MAARVLIAGYYGFDNAGDEAIAESLVYALRHLRPDLDITILSAQPARTRAALDVNAVDRFSPTVAAAIWNTDAVIFGGGTLLQDVTSFRSLSYYLAILALAEASRRKVVVYANGLGPIRSALGRFLVSRLLRRATAVSLRDRDSLEEAKRLGITEAQLTADPVFLLPPADETESEALRQRERWTGLQGPVVGVSVRPWGENSLLISQLAQTLDRLASEGCQVVFVPMQHPRDVELSRQVQASMQRSSFLMTERYRPRQLLALCGHLDLMIGLRLHALVFAVSQGVPVVGISYDPKVDSFLREVGCPRAGTAASLDAEVLYECCQRTVADPLLREHLRTQAEDYRKTAWATAQSTVAML